MAMEVKRNSKQLHVHAVPVVLTVVALLIVSVAGLKSYGGDGLSTDALLARTLVTPVLEIHPSATGLASVRLHQKDPSVQTSLSQAGQTANTMFDFVSAGPSLR